MSGVGWFGSSLHNWMSVGSALYKGTLNLLFRMLVVVPAEPISFSSIRFHCQFLESRTLQDASPHLPRSRRINSRRPPKPKHPRDSRI
jgi:hypothetical protein